MERKLRVDVPERETSMCKDPVAGGSIIVFIYDYHGFVIH